MRSRTSRSRIGSERSVDNNPGADGNDHTVDASVGAFAVPLSERRTYASADSKVGLSHPVTPFMITSRCDIRGISVTLRMRRRSTRSGTGWMGLTMPLLAISRRRLEQRQGGCIPTAYEAGWGCRMARIAEGDQKTKARLRGHFVTTGRPPDAHTCGASLRCEQAPVGLPEDTFLGLEQEGDPRSHLPFALAKLYLARKQLLALTGSGRPVQVVCAYRGTIALQYVHRNPDIIRQTCPISDFVASRGRNESANSEVLLFYTTQPREGETQFLIPDTVEKDGRRGLLSVSVSF